MTSLYAIHFYRIYDIGEDLDLDTLESRLSGTMPIARTCLVRVQPTSISIGEAPLRICLPPIPAMIQGVEYTFTAEARVYDFGSLSICLMTGEQDVPPSALQEEALRFSNQAGLDDYFRGVLAQVRAILAPVAGDRKIDADFYDDYTLFFIDRSDPRIDPVVVLLGERGPFSPEIQGDILKNQLSYEKTDAAILSFSGALLTSPAIPHDLIELIGFACVQVFELRFYDRELTRQVEKMYGDLEAAENLSWFARFRRYRAIMRVLMRTQAEVSEVIEKVNNLIKTTDDAYYARVYEMALSVMKSREWAGSVDRRIRVIRENYRMLSDEVNAQHSNFLTWIIIVLIAVAVALFLPEAFT